jgi:hypothetical protein
MKPGDFIVAKGHEHPLVMKKGRDDGKKRDA